MELAGAVAPILHLPFPYTPYHFDKVPDPHRLEVSFLRPFQSLGEGQSQMGARGVEPPKTVKAASFTDSCNLPTVATLPYGPGGTRTHVVLVKS